MTNVLDEMHDWIADCCWGDMDDDALEALTAEDIVNGVEQHYIGGVNQFIADNAFPGRRCQECGSDDHFSLAHLP